ncbi:hypothetical protein [Paludibacterium purpuratum]|uniref:Lipoprotein n=1 Tax=Paludibacterium purpuratum TaxID=1144873 RepID=A0A4R7BGI5_9NEIS|nr:hypothetical protein [Paludibacterium purpuratum]TDR82836.1 hypothetical protein DFP86_101226 [Paludibacterium purpuratum]
MVRKIALFAFVLVLAGCGSTKGTVLRYENSVVASFQASSADEAEEESIEAAEEYCEDRGGDLVVLSRDRGFKEKADKYFSKLTFRCRNVDTPS